MKVVFLNNFNDLDLNLKNLSLVLGYFDGVHIGHSQLISFAKSMSEGGDLAVLTFDKPLKSIEGCLTNLDTKKEIMKSLGVDYLLVIVCDDNFKKMSYVNFINKVLKTLKPTKLFCGPDFRYGYGAQGDVQFLKERFNDVYVLNYVNDHHGNKISSSEIKDLILEGKITEANRWLGREYMITGIVSHGKSNGKTLGFPTANLIPDTNYVIPKNGVYVTRCKVDGVIYPSITNIGTHPTINELLVPSIETFLIGYEGNLYGEEISLYFDEFLREEQKFNSIDELKAAIEKNKEDAIHYFKFNKIR